MTSLPFFQKSPALVDLQFNVTKGATGI